MYAQIFCARPFVVTIFVSLRRRRFTFAESAPPKGRKGEREKDNVYAILWSSEGSPSPRRFVVSPRCARCVYLCVCARHAVRLTQKGCPEREERSAGERAGKGKIREGSSSGKAKVKGKNEAHISGPAYDADDDDDGDAGDTHTRKTKDSSTVSPPPYRAPDRLPLARAANCFRRTNRQR